MRLSSILSFVAIVSTAWWVGFGTACSDDDPDPRVSPGTGGGNHSGGSSIGTNDSDPDAGDDAGDVEQDSDVDEFACDLQPDDDAADPARPCCFDDSDCWESDAPGAEQMLCYHADCDGGYQGVCRHPPEHPDDCWSDWDCEQGYICPYQDNPDNLDCTIPHQEVPDVCVPEQ